MRSNVFPVSLLLSSFLLLVLTSGAVRAEKTGSGVLVGVFGNTWRIAEPDQAEVLKRRALRNRDKLEAAYKRMVERAHESILSRIAHLDPVTKREVVFLDTTYTLDEPIYFPGKDGRWYYFPAGFTFNPMKYISALSSSVKYFVIDPERKGEVDFVRRFLAENPGTDCRVLLAGVPVDDLSLNCSTAFLSGEAAEKLKLKGTVAIISPEGDGLRIEYVPVRKEENGNPKNPE